MKIPFFILVTMRQAVVKLLHGAVILIMAALVLDVLWGVFSRYAIGHQTNWTEEVATILLMWISLLGGGLAYAEKGHLGVDYFTGKLVPSAQRLNDIIVHLIVGLFAAASMVYGGWLLFSRTLQAGQTLPALQIQAGYKYIIVPISGCFMVLFAIEHIAELLAGKKPEGASHD
ncbi:MAG: TRAP transporter small permease [Planctomycetales bacterium]|nr:TRAP transporter small permease [Planctomycetales bacterium]